MNFSRAAEALCITQPAVSQHIQYLEREYGVKLFRKEGKRIYLTGEGRILRETMAVIKNDEQIMRERMRECRSGKRELSFGVTMTIGEYTLLAPLAAYLKAHPERNVRVRYGNTAKLEEELREGSIDFALVEGYFRKEAYDSLRFDTEQFIPVCAAVHSFLREPHSLRDLVGERLILREPGSGTRNILERSLAVKGLSVQDFQRRTEIENMHTIIGLLERDCGISFLYRVAVRDQLLRGTLRELLLEDFKLEHDFAFIWPRGSAFREDYHAISEELRGYREL